ncbi:MAG: CsgG/HfaB family protein [Candidatus Aminicenantes bacterium]
MEEKELLESWKEISAYLNRNIRTCQYWEKRYALPIHRIEDSPKARVFAYKKELDRWLEEMLREGEVAKKNIFISLIQKYKTFSLITLALLSLVISTMIILRFFPAQEAVETSTLKPSIVIMPFKNNSGTKNLEHLRWALSDMLITDLSQSKYVRVFRKDKIFSILVELDLLNAQSFASNDLRKIALGLDATHIIQGSYIKFGEEFRIDIDVIDARSMKSIGTEKVKGVEESSISEMIDDLTRKIKSHLNLTDEAIAHDIDERVGKVTTSSPAAYKLYIEGRNHHNFNEYNESIESMNKALENDEEFALAYTSISDSYKNLGLLSKSREYAEKALEFSDRITERERYHLQIQFYSSSERTWDKAIDAGLRLIQLYPDDIGGSDLAELYLLLEQWDAAIERYRVFVLNQEIAYFPYRGIVASYEAKGMYDKAGEILENYLLDISEHPSVRWQLAFQFLCQGKFDRALDEAANLDPWNSEIKGNIYHSSGELDKAEREYMNMLDSNISIDVASARRYLGSLYLMQGRYEEAKKQFSQGVIFADTVGELSWKHEIHSELAYFYLVTGDPVKALDECNTALKCARDEGSIRRQIESLHLKGLIYLKMKSMDEAQRIADELRDLIDDWLNRKLMRYYYHLIGRLELIKENFSGAIGNFKKAMTLLPYQHYEWHYRLPMAHSLFLGSLADAYYKTGDFESAEQEYEKITHLTIGKLWYGDVFTNSHYMLARVFEHLRQREKAITHYDKYLALTKNADPGIREIEDAKKRLAGLKSQ